MPIYCTHFTPRDFIKSSITRVLSSAVHQRPEDYLENDYLPGTVKHVVNLSGGKDSTAMLLMMLEDKKPIIDAQP